jgi:aspartyl-tRNA(Asn)/glutamyl-tRNA(Gln) amidotransferase subunit C
MNVNDELIDKIANLARLKFNSEEKEDIRKDLEQMIGFIDKLGELDTTGIEPLLHMSENVNVLREDEVSGTISREEAFRNAPLHDEQFFKVPKVIRK